MTTPPDPLPARDDEPIVPAPQMAAWRTFLTAHARLTDQLADELRDRVGLSLSWYDVLVQLSESEGHRLRMQDLAQRVLLSRSGLTRLIDRMERDGLVTRSPCEDDRRGTWAQMTERGYEVIRSSAPAHLAGIREHFADVLTDDEAEVLTSALGRVVEQLGP